MGNLKWLLIGLAGLLVVFLITQSMQSRHQVKTDRVFTEDTDAIFKFEVEQEGKALKIARHDTTWVIVGHDSLKMRDYRIQAFLNTVLNVKRETVMTQKAENWEKYSVDDSTGTHVRLYDVSDNLLGSAVFGRSVSDWSRNYVRLGEGPEVFLTETTVIHLVSNRPDHWGEKPEPLEDKAEALMKSPMMGSTIISAKKEDGTTVVDTME